MKRPLNLFFCFLIPAALLVTGWFYGAGYRSRHMPELMKDIGQGMAPPGFIVPLPEKGKYTLWLATASMIDGRSYTHSGDLPEEAKFQLVEKNTGRGIELFPLKSKRKFQGEKAVSIADFEIAEPYQNIEVKATGLKSPVLLSIAPDRRDASINLLLHLLGTISVTLFLAFVSLAVLLHHRKKQIIALSGS